MTTHSSAAGRNRDMQDLAERHSFVSMEAVEGGGHIVKVRGTGTEDEEAFVMFPGGLGIRPPKGADIEVHMISDGSYTGLKYALITIPHDKEHKWAEGHNGLQKFDDPDRRLQWGPNLLHMTDQRVAFGPGGMLEIGPDGVTIRGKLNVKESVAAAKLSCASPVFCAGLAGPEGPTIGGFAADV